MHTRVLLLSLLLISCVSSCRGQSASRSSFDDSAPAPAASVLALPVNASLLHFPYSLSDFGSHVFSSETACTASEEVVYLSITNMTVPVEEVQSFAIKTWQAPNYIGAQIENVTYFNLETGRIVYGDAIYDWNQGLTYFNYSLLTPNIVDMPAYQEWLLQLNYTISNLTTGITPIRRCQTPIPQLQSVSNFLNSVLTKNVSNTSNLDGGLRPTELRLPGGCISESNTNYAGKVLQEIRTNKTSQGDCCAACQANPDCNVWVWCASFSGCMYGNNQVFPQYGCDLKHQANYTDMSQLPLSFTRGPPSPFTSGRYVKGR
ncbi:hypothetical protein ABBQ38_015377 [Trebouxia sp. C0009 RCD-2024]